MDIRLARSSAPTNAELVARVSQDDQEAWDQLVDRYTPMLDGLARSYRLDEARRGCGAEHLAAATRTAGDAS